MRLILLCSLGVALFAYDNDSPKDIDPTTLPGPVYALDTRGLFAVAEAEHLAAVGVADHQNVVWWTAQDENSSGASVYWSGGGEPCLGEGFVVYTGPQRQGPEFMQDEAPYGKMGPQQQWLVLKFYVPPGKQGEYQFAYRYAHLKHDGDNDCFVGSIGISDEPIKRSGWKARKAFSFSPGFEVRANSRHYCNVGINAFFISGRSKGFAIDRLVVWRRKGGDADAAKDVATPASPVLSKSSKR